nr:putative polyprotein [Bactericera trigonica virus SGhosh-2022a]
MQSPTMKDLVVIVSFSVVHVLYKKILDSDRFSYLDSHTIHSSRNASATEKIMDINAQKDKEYHERMRYAFRIIRCMVGTALNPWDLPYIVASVIVFLFKNWHEDTTVTIEGVLNEYESVSVLTPFVAACTVAYKLYGLSAIVIDTDWRNPLGLVLNSDEATWGEKIKHLLGEGLEVIKKIFFGLGKCANRFASVIWSLLKSIIGMFKWIVKKIWNCANKIKDYTKLTILKFMGLDNMHKYLNWFKTDNPNEDHVDDVTSDSDVVKFLYNYGMSNFAKMLMSRLGTASFINPFEHYIGKIEPFYYTYINQILWENIIEGSLDTLAEIVHKNGSDHNRPVIKRLRDKTALWFDFTLEYFWESCKKFSDVVRARSSGPWHRHFALLENHFITIYYNKKNKSYIWFVMNGDNTWVITDYDIADEATIEILDNPIVTKIYDDMSNYSFKNEMSALIQTWDIYEDRLEKTIDLLQNHIAAYSMEGQFTASTLHLFFNKSILHHHVRNNKINKDYLNNLVNKLSKYSRITVGDSVVVPGAFTDVTDLNLFKSRQIEEIKHPELAKTNLTCIKGCRLNGPKARFLARFISPLSENSQLCGLLNFALGHDVVYEGDVKLMFDKFSTCNDCRTVVSRNTIKQHAVCKKNVLIYPATTSEIIVRDGKLAVSWLNQTGKTERFIINRKNDQRHVEDLVSHRDKGPCIVLLKGDIHYYLNISKWKNLEYSFKDDFTAAAIRDFKNDEQIVELAGNFGVLVHSKSTKHSNWFVLNKEIKLAYPVHKSDAVIINLLNTNNNFMIYKSDVSKKAKYIDVDFQKIDTTTFSYTVGSYLKINIEQEKQYPIIMEKMMFVKKDIDSQSLNSVRVSAWSPLVGKYNNDFEVDKDTKYRAIKTCGRNVYSLKYKSHIDILLKKESKKKLTLEEAMILNSITQNSIMRTFNDTCKVDLEMSKNKFKKFFRKEVLLDSRPNVKFNYNENINIIEKYKPNFIFKAEIIRVRKEISAAHNQTNCFKEDTATVESEALKNYFLCGTDPDIADKYSRAIQVQWQEYRKHPIENNLICGPYKYCYEKNLLYWFNSALTKVKTNKDTLNLEDPKDWANQIENHTGIRVTDIFVRNLFKGRHVFKKTIKNILDCSSVKSDLQIEILLKYDFKNAYYLNLTDINLYHILSVYDNCSNKVREVIELDANQIKHEDSKIWLLRLIYYYIALNVIPKNFIDQYLESEANKIMKYVSVPKKTEIQRNLTPIQEIDSPSELITEEAGGDVIVEAIIEQPPTDTTELMPEFRQRELDDLTIKEQAIMDDIIDQTNIGVIKVTLAKKTKKRKFKTTSEISRETSDNLQKSDILGDMKKTFSSLFSKDAEKTPIKKEPVVWYNKVPIDGSTAEQEEIISDLSTFLETDIYVKDDQEVTAITSKESLYDEEARPLMSSGDEREVPEIELFSKPSRLGRLLSSLLPERKHKPLISRKDLAEVKFDEVIHKRAELTKDIANEIVKRIEKDDLDVENTLEHAVHFGRVTHRTLEVIHQINDRETFVDMSDKRIKQGPMIIPLTSSTSVSPAPEISNSLIERDLKKLSSNVKGHAWEVMKRYHRVELGSNAQGSTVTKGYFKALLMNHDLALFENAANVLDVACGGAGFIQAHINIHINREKPLQLPNGYKRSYTFTSLKREGHVNPMLDPLFNQIAEHNDNVKGRNKVKYDLKKIEYKNNDFRYRKVYEFAEQNRTDYDLIIVDCGESSENLKKESSWYMTNIKIMSKKNSDIISLKPGLAVLEYSKLNKIGGNIIIKMLGFTHGVEEMTLAMSSRYRKLVAWKAPTSSYQSREWYLICIGRLYTETAPWPNIKNWLANIKFQWYNNFLNYKNWCDANCKRLLKDLSTNSAEGFGLGLDVVINRRKEYLATLGENYHLHNCLKCGKLYTHTHEYEREDHNQLAYQCPNMACEWFFKNAPKIKHNWEIMKESKENFSKLWKKISENSEEKPFFIYAPPDHGKTIANLGFKGPQKIEVYAGGKLADTDYISTWHCVPEIAFTNRLYLLDDNLTSSKNSHIKQNNILGLHDCHGIILLPNEKGFFSKLRPKLRREAKENGWYEDIMNRANRLEKSGKFLVIKSDQFIGEIKEVKDLVKWNNNFNVQFRNDARENKTLAKLVDKKLCVENVKRPYVPTLSCKWKNPLGNWITLGQTELKQIIESAELRENPIDNAFDEEYEYLGEKFKPQLKERLELVKKTIYNNRRKILPPSGKFKNVLEVGKIDFKQNFGKEKHTSNMLIHDYLFNIIGITPSNSVIGHTQCNKEAVEAAHKKRLDLHPKIPAYQDQQVLYSASKAACTPEYNRIADGPDKNKFDIWTFEETTKHINNQGAGGHFDKFRNFAEAVQDKQFKIDVQKRLEDLRNGKPVNSYQTCRDKRETKAKKVATDDGLITEDLLIEHLGTVCCKHIYLNHYGKIDEEKPDEQYQAKHMIKHRDIKLKNKVVKELMKLSANISPRNIRYAEFVQRFVDLMILGPYQYHHNNVEKMYKGSITGIPYWDQGQLIRAIYEVFLPIHEQDIITGDSLIEQNRNKFSNKFLSKFDKRKIKVELIKDKEHVINQIRQQRIKIASGDFSGWDGTLNNIDHAIEFLHIAKVYKSKHRELIKNRYTLYMFSITITDPGNIIVSEGQRGSGDQGTSSGNSFHNENLHIASIATALGITCAEAAEPIAIIHYLTGDNKKWKKHYVLAQHHLVDGDDNIHIATANDIMLMNSTGLQFIKRCGKTIRCGNADGYNITTDFNEISFCSHSYIRTRISYREENIYFPPSFHAMPDEDFANFISMLDNEKLSTKFFNQELGLIGNKTLIMQRLYEAFHDCDVKYLPKRPIPQIVGKLCFTIKNEVLDFSVNRDYLYATNWLRSNTSEQKINKAIMKNERAIEITRGKILAYLLNYPHIETIKIMTTSLLSVIGDGTVDVNNLKRRGFHIPSTYESVSSALKSVFGIESLKQIDTLPRGFDREGLKTIRANTKLQFPTLKYFNENESTISFGLTDVIQLKEKSDKWIKSYCAKEQISPIDYSFHFLKNNKQIIEDKPKKQIEFKRKLNFSNLFNFLTLNFLNSETQKQAKEGFPLMKQEKEHFSLITNKKLSNIKRLEEKTGIKNLQTKLSMSEIKNKHLFKTIEGKHLHLTFIDA